MKRLLRTLIFAAACGVAIPTACYAATPATTPSVALTAHTTAGADIAIPNPSKITVIAFLRAKQEQSDDAVKQITQTVQQNPDAAQVIVAISGETDPADVQKFVDADKIAWPIVLDPDYAICGKLSVRVWPTTVVIATDGTQAAHLAGLSPSFPSDLAAHIEYAARKIDAAALADRLTTKQVVTDSPQQMAVRHVRIASALLDKGDLTGARSEIDQGLARVPGDASLRVLQVKVLLKQNQPADALAAAEQLKEVVPPWQFNLLRAESLVGLQRWPDAKQAAVEATKLNPNPASAYYLSGVIAAQEKDFEHAADAFRKAYEAASGGSSR